MSRASDNRAGANVLFLVIGADRIEAGVRSGAGARADWLAQSLASVPILNHGVSADPQVELLATMLALPSQLTVGLPLSGLHVLVAECWLAAAGIPWSSSLRRAATEGGYARSQLLMRGFRLAPEDILRLDDAGFGCPRLAVAYPGTLLAALHGLASDLATRLVSVLPLGAASWAWAQSQPAPRPRALAVLHGPMTVFMHRAAGRGHPEDLSLRLSEDAASARQELPGLWKRLCARDAPLARLEPLCLLTLGEASPASRLGEASPMLELAPPSSPLPVVPTALLIAAGASHASQVLDGLSRTAPARAMAWVAAAAVVLLAVLLSVQAGQSALNRQSTQHALQSAQGAPLRKAVAAAWSREELQRVNAVNQAIRELNLPISALLQALQPPGELRVAVLSVETLGKGASASRSASGQQAQGLRIVAEARSGAEMARYVAFVAGRKPFAAAYLTRHEIDDSGSLRPYRFTVEASWAD